MTSLKRRIFLQGSLFAASLWFSSLMSQKGRASEPSQMPRMGKASFLSQATRELIDNNTAFAVDLYRFLAAESSDNLFFSPYSISAALAMTYAGARGITATEMAEVLKFSLPSHRLHPAFANLQSILEAKDTENYQLSIANRLWGQAEYPILKKFVQITQQYYDSDLETVDFVVATETTRRTINTWAEEQTNGKIKELLAPGILTGLTRLVLTNAVYFKAQWLEPFEPELTSEETFTIAPNQKIAVPMMKGETYESKYIVLRDIKLLELFYQNLEQSIVIILPRQIDGLTQLEQRLTPSLLKTWMTALDNYERGGRLDVWLPKFKISSEFKLNESLSDLGMPSAFNNQANFSGIDGRLELYLDAVVHKAFLDVDEFGTEAAAATAAVVGLRGARGECLVDRPFLLLIRDTKSKSILFLGRVMNPLG